MFWPSYLFFQDVHTSNDLPWPLGDKFKLLSMAQALPGPLLCFFNLFFLASPQLYLRFRARQVSCLHHLRLRCLYNISSVWHLLASSKALKVQEDLDVVVGTCLASSPEYEFAPVSLHVPF
jgi:hypothetical protein